MGADGYAFASRQVWIGSVLHGDLYRLRGIDEATADRARQAPDRDAATRIVLETAMLRPQYDAAIVDRMSDADREAMVSVVATLTRQAADAVGAA